MSGIRLSQIAMSDLRWQEAILNRKLKEKGERPNSFHMVACGCYRDCAFISTHPIGFTTRKIK